MSYDTIAAIRGIVDQWIASGDLSPTAKIWPIAGLNSIIDMGESPHPELGGATRCTPQQIFYMRSLRCALNLRPEVIAKRIDEITIQVTCRNITVTLQTYPQDHGMYQVAFRKVNEDVCYYTPYSVGILFQKQTGIKADDVIDAIACLLLIPENKVIPEAIHKPQKSYAKRPQ